MIRPASTVPVTLSYKWQIQMETIHSGPTWTSTPPSTSSSLPYSQGLNPNLLHPWLLVPPNLPIANEWSRSFRGEAATTKRGGQVVGKARFANECACLICNSPRSYDLRCDDNSAHSYAVMRNTLVLATLLKRP